VISLHAAFTSTVWVIDWIHDDSTYCRPNSHVPRATRFSNSDVFVIEIADLTDGGDTVNVHQSHLA
jgi:hypothetical protein